LKQRRVEEVVVRGCHDDVVDRKSGKKDEKRVGGFVAEGERG